jgi:hypothetical protein
MSLFRIRQRLLRPVVIPGRPPALALVVGGAPEQPQPGQPAPAAGASPDQLTQARAVFREMQQAYTAGDYIRYGQLMQQLGQILSSL